MEKKYRLRYLPLFEQDLAAAKDYISINLQSPVAAERLVEAAEKAIQKRLLAPLSLAPYHSKRHRKHPYYRIHVKNYSVFYVVIDDIMELRRFIYSKRNLSELL
jgi:plasmid stabilization system protein ParE